MTNKSFKSLLNRAVVLPSVLLAILAMLLLWQFARLSSASRWVLHTDEVVDQARQLQEALLDMETGVRGYLLSGNLEFLQPYQAAKPKIPFALSNLAQLASTKPRQVARVQILRQGIEKWTDYAERKISSRGRGKSSSQFLLTEGESAKTLMDDLRHQIQQFISEENSIQNARTNDFESVQRGLILLIVIATFLLAVILVYFGRRQLKTLSIIYESERAIREIFVSTLSHDLRNPISTVQMSSQLLLDEPGGPPIEREKLVKMIFNAAQRANRMIENLLDANRIKAGERLSLNIEIQDLCVIAKEIIEDLKLVYKNHIEIISQESSIQGQWSADAVRRMLENLITNAIKYGTKDSTITVNLRVPPKQAEFSVHNDGNPLTAEEQIKLFEPFQRSLSAQTSGQHGWGLGLTLVQGLAEAHGGNVRVESSLEAGTTFTVCLPQWALRAPGRAV